jgi:hypothetical protein
MRTLKCVLVLAVPVVCVAAVLSADHLIPERTTIELLMLRQKSVQKELNVSPELAKKVADFTHQQHEKFSGVFKLGEDDRKQKLMELQKENKQFLEENLSAEQRKRLFQITLQATGLHELNRPEVAETLNLTAEQQEKFKELQKEHRKQLEEIIHPRGRATRNDKLAKLREDTRTKVQAILTDEQKAKVRDLVGEPFKGEILFEAHESEEKDYPGK